MWDYKTNKIVQQYRITPTRPENFITFLFDPEGEKLILGKMSLVYIFDQQTGELLTETHIAPRPNRMNFLYDNERILIDGSGRWLIVSSIDGSLLFQEDGYASALSKNGKEMIVAHGGIDLMFDLWSAESKVDSQYNYDTPSRNSLYCASKFKVCDLLKKRKE